MPISKETLEKRVAESKKRRSEKGLFDKLMDTVRPEEEPAVVEEPVEEAPRPALADRVTKKPEPALTGLTEAVTRPKTKLRKAADKKAEERPVPTPQMAEDRKKAAAATQMLSSAPKALKPSPETGKPETSLSEITKRHMANLDKALGDVDSKYRKKFEAIASDLDRKLDEKADVRQQNAWYRVAQTMLNALAQLGTAQYGRKHGVNMAGTPVVSADWDAILKSNLDKVNDEMAALREQRDLGEQERKEQAGRVTTRSASELDAEIQDYISKAKAQAAQASEAPMEAKLDLTPAQKKVDENFAKNYIEWTAKGGEADARKQIRQLDRVLGKIVETDSATGPMVGVLPRMVREVLNPASAALQDQVEEVIQRNLRAVLGAQFTEKEGERLISRAYNPRLEEEENARRLANLLQQMKEAYAANEAARSYFEKNGTLQGFKGEIYNTVDDFDLDRPIQAEAKPEMSARDKQALDWANKNPNDPRAAKIKQRLGVK